MIPNDKHELQEFLAKEDERFALADEIEKERDYLLSVDGDCYPFSHKHIQEALGNMPEANSMVISAYIGTAEDCPSNDFAQSAVSSVIRRFIKEYWEKIAERLAEKNVYGRQ